MATADEIKAALADRASEVCSHLLPAGIIEGDEFLVGSLSGEAGRSLHVNLNGACGKWRDFATDDKGSNLLDLWCRVRTNGDFTAAMREAAGWLGISDDRGRLVDSWIYTDPQGALWIRVERYDLANGDKRYSQFDLRAGQRIRKGGHQLPTPRPLYRLHTFYGKTNGSVVLPEGEKCADALVSLGIDATATIGGKGQVHLADFAPLAGWTVTLWPDADEPGTAYARIAATKLLEVGATVRRVCIPDGKVAGWDVADAVRDGWTREQIVALIDAAEIVDDVPPSEAEAPGRFRFLSDTELEDMPAPEWRIEDRIPAIGIVAAFGQPGVLKTTTILDIACSIAALPLWADCAVKPGLVLYVVAESAAAFPVRVKAWKQYHGITGTIPLRFLTNPVQLNSASEVRDFIAALDTLPEMPAVIVFDTLSRCMVGADENSARDMGVVIAALDDIRRATGGAVIVVHHTGKNGEDERGSSALRGASDTMLKIEREDDTLTVFCRKMKDGAEFPPITFTVHVEHLADGQSACVLVPGADEPTAHRPRVLPETRQKALDALRKQFDADGATNTEWFRLSGMKEPTFRRAIKDLVRWGVVEKPNVRGGRYRVAELPS